MTPHIKFRPKVYCFKLIHDHKRNCERIGRSVAPLLMKAIADHIYKEILCKIKK